MLQSPLWFFVGAFRFFAISNIRWFCVGHFLSVVFQTVRRNLFLFTFIVLVLVSAKWIRSEWMQVQGIVKEVPALRAVQDELNAHQATVAQRLARQVEQLSGATVQQLDEQIRGLDHDIRIQQRERDTVALPSGAFKGADRIVDHVRQQAMRAAEIELRRQARDHLIALRARLVVLGNRQAALDTLKQLQLAHVRMYALYQGRQQELLHQQALGGLLVNVPFTAPYERVQQLAREVDNLRAANRKAYKDFRTQQALLDGMSLPAPVAAFRVDEQRLVALAAPLRERLRRAEGLSEQNHVWQAYLVVRPVLPAALGVLIGWWLVPAVIRTFFYFVLAPLAARRPPIVIAQAQGSAPASPSANAQGARQSSVISAVSQNVNLAAGDEMLVRPDYCQSQPAGVHVTTKLLFSWRHWLTSVAAHLWMLKRLRTMQPADVVVSSTVDALDDVALLEIAEGEAIVLQPRGLVGMICKAGQRPVIRSHWRLGTLHAWLTLQLRYLAFEGPVTLIVKGCRGVRLESALSGRTISQDATLGFSVNAMYSTVRADPFVPYLRGRQPLFHDQFSGPDAYFLYEEVPRNMHPGGQKRNPLEVVFDAGLKAFGI
ncbi:hypothetical protein INH39_15405 [Massilia violaceinigra]|uniref:SSD domain-containing protein n=1 Tax=Massilia violaceinigra TaxID=2045208 RepID=A0ABY4AEU2_9BURK|nr:hypothetical protein [Massilia violaceinigra]UOD32917.1 hypothetical protein INH39_15405 [Massilia violaceinigra]